MSAEKCTWAYRNHLEEVYHDEEWGTPHHDDHRMFEFLILEGMQAGLSWTTIIKRREAMRHAFDGFSVEALAGYDEGKIDALMNNPEVIRHRLKLQALSKNAKAFQAVQAEYGSFDSYIWSFTDGLSIVGHWTSMEDIPLVTPWAEYISKDLKKRGFTFVGPTIVQSFLQAIGILNDHVKTCPRYQELMTMGIPSVSYTIFARPWVEAHPPKKGRRL